MMQLPYFVLLIVQLSCVSALASRESNTAADLFPFETIQLQDSDLDYLNQSIATLFSSADGNVTNAIHVPRNSKGCKVFPGDLEWPVDVIWDIFNDLLGGALIKTIPIAASCYNGPHYDANRCTYVTDNWTNSTMHCMWQVYKLTGDPFFRCQHHADPRLCIVKVMNLDQSAGVCFKKITADSRVRNSELDPTSMMTPLYQGMTCLPTANPNDTCTLGGYPSYAVNVTNVKQIQLAVNFARATGIRLVVRNTGHDFGGKSGGAGALAIWTHHLNSIQYIPDYVDTETNYSGPAFKCGSGVIGRDIYAYAANYGLAVFGGEAADVGVYGGYTQGGGHGPLTSLYGMGADQVLSIQVVLPSGEFVTASSTENSDIFWALRGGGGGTFGVVTSMTVRAFPSTEVTVARYSFTVSNTTSEDAFWEGVRAYWDNIPTFADAGVYCYFFIFPGPTFYMTFFTPNYTQADTETLLQPFLNVTAELGITDVATFDLYPSIYEGWLENFPQEAVGTDNVAIGSRLFPRDNWANDTLNNAAFDAWSASGKAGSVLIGMNCAAPNKWGVDNAVLPAWRNSVLHSMQGTSWDEGANSTTIVAATELLTQRQQIWKSVTPNSGAYLNECDIRTQDFQEEFYGENYPRLLSIKREVDPWNVLWARTAVGSEVMSVRTFDAIEDENGRLCWN